MRRFLFFALIILALVGLSSFNYDDLYSQLINGESFQEPAPQNSSGQISACWSKIQRGIAVGTFSFDTISSCFPGKQSQTIQFVAGEGEIGIDNSGIGHLGINFLKGKPYEGIIRVRTELPVDIAISLQNADGTKKLAETILKTYGKPNDYQRLEFTLYPSDNDEAGHFAITLRKPGIITLGYVFLQPGVWGRYRNMPVRKEVAESLIEQGVKTIRFNASIPSGLDVKNRSAYPFKWKNMIGPREMRLPLCSSTDRIVTCGWGFSELLRFCEASGITAVPGLSVRELPQDIVDFVEYIKGQPNTKWGKKRALDGHIAPYQIKVIEIGSELPIDEEFMSKYKILADMIKKKDIAITVSMADWLHDR